MSHSSGIRFALTALLAMALGACGGYGGGGYSSMSNMPTVQFSSPAQTGTINFGQSLTVSWTSTYTTSCTASTSAAAAGAFTGSQTTSGSMQVAPTAPGSYTYSLMCTGMGGSASATSPTVTVGPSTLSLLSTAPMATIGSTVIPAAMQGNPYGLAIAPATAGLITQGDLIVCNFNDAGGTEGNGTDIIGLHPTANSQPYAIANSPLLQGCNALAVFADDSIAAAGWSSLMNPLVTATGTVNTPFSGSAISQPWGEAYVASTSMHGAALYISNAPADPTTLHGNGTIDRIALDGDAQMSVTEIVTGFCTVGSPGAIYAPSGLTYDAGSDTLYVVDTASNSVIAIADVSAVGADGVTVNGQCGAVNAPPTAQPTFSGASASSARVIAHGAPLSSPLSAALLGDGDLIVGNADIGVSSSGPMVNLMIEVSPVLPGGFVGQPFQADNTTPGALFGIAAATDAQGNQIVYFNDDNTSMVQRLGPVAVPVAPPGYRVH